MQYQLKLQQLVTYSRCRIYRNFIRTLAEDTNIRLNGDSYLFYFMVLCSLANFRTSYMQVDGISYTIAPGEWMIASRDMMKLFRKKTMKSTVEIFDRLSDKNLISYRIEPLFREGGERMREAEILELLESHDEQGMEELLTHYGPLMRYVIKPILRDKHDIEDCLSETAMRIWENFDTYDENKGSFAAWVTAITRNTALNMIRRKNRHPENEIEDEIESTEPTPEEIVLREERQRELRRALDLLSQKERNLFYRKYYYLQSTEKIAAEMGMTVRSVEGKLYRLKKKLRKMMGGDEDEV